MASPYMVMPGARIGIENGHLVESLGQSHLAGIGNGGIGSGIGMQAFAGPCCLSCANGGPCATGDDAGEKAGPFVALAAIVIGIALIPKMLKYR